MATAVVDPSTGLPPVQKPPQEDPELTRLRGEVTKQKSDLDALKARFTAPPAPAANNQPMSSTDMAREFYKDPIASSVAIAQKVLQDQQRQGNDASRATLIQVAKDSVRNSSPENAQLFDKYILEIEAAVTSVDPQFQTNINVWKHALNLAKGSHIDEIMEDRRKAAGQPAAGEEPARAPAVHIRAGEGPGQSSNRPAAAAKGEELSQDEKRTARRLGLSEDSYKMGKKHVAEQNDAVSDPVGKSSWDPFITFDSRERKRRLRAEQLAAKGAK